MADEVKETVLIDLKINKGQAEKDVDSLTGKIDDLTESNKDLAKANADLEKAGQKNTQAYKDNAKQIEVNKQELAKNTTERKNLIQVMKVEENSINALRAQNALLTAQRNNLNTSTKEGREELERLNKALDENNAKIKENVDAQTKQKIGIGSYTSSIKEALAQSGPFGASLTSIADQGTKLFSGPTAIFASGVAVVGALVGLYAKSTLGARDLEIAQDKLGASFKALSNNLAALTGAKESGGFFSGLADTFNFITGGSANVALGRLIATAKQALKEIELAELSAQKFAKDQLNLAEEQRRLRDDDTASFSERLKAAQSVEGFINDREKELVDIQERKLKQVKALLSNDAENLELKKEVKQIEFEIADIQEDSQGKRTEALNGILTLEKEIAEQQKVINDDAKAKRRADQDEEREVSRAIILQQGNEEVKLKKTLGDQQIAINKKVNDVTTAANKKAAEEKAKIDVISAAERTQAELNFYATTSQAIRVFGGRNKAAASAAAIVDTGLAVTRILSSPATPFVEPFASVTRALQIAIALKTGQNAVKQIQSAQFAQGGSVKGVKYGTVGGKPHSQGGTKYYGEDGHVVEFEKNEGWYVAKVGAHQDILNSMSSINQKHGGRSWSMGSASPSRFDLGGQVPISGGQGLSARDVLDAVSQMRIQVAVTDINDGQSKFAEVIERATF